METTPAAPEAPTRPTAESLNAHLAAGGFVQVTTYTRSTLYKPGTVTFFEKPSGSLVEPEARNLYLRNARNRTECISSGPRLLVGVVLVDTPSMHGL